jgi:hypothetical protein
MATSRTYRVVGEEFFHSAPVRGTLRQKIPASAAATFACLEDADAWPVWLDPVEAVVWTSPRPFDVGTTRDITAKVGTISEVFFAWEPGVRMSFYFQSGAIPVLAAFAEDYEVVPLGEDSCELVWNWAGEMAPRFGFAGKVFGALFKRGGVKSLKQLADYMQTHGDSYKSEA